MAERAPEKLIKNDNKNRLRLKVRKNYSKKAYIDKLRKRDRRMKGLISLFVFAVLATLSALLIAKRVNLSNDMFEYNRLQADIVSYELQRDRLRSRLEEAVDLNSIQRYAIEDLNMVYNSENAN